LHPEIIEQHELAFKGAPTAADQVEETTQVASTTTEAAREQQEKKQRIPDLLPQLTGEEIRNVARALADVRTFHRWEELSQRLVGEIAIRHAIHKDARVRTTIRGEKLLDWWKIKANPHQLKQVLGN
jgi:predicted acetyltransferase